MHKRSMASVFGCAVLLTTGCATSGTVDKLTNVPINAYARVVEGSGAVAKR